MTEKAPIHIRLQRKQTQANFSVYSHSSSRELDDWVAKKLHKGISIYHVDQHELKLANPQLILTQDLCEVCAPSFNDVESACKIVDAKPKIISLEPTSLDQIMENVLTVGRET